MRARSGPDGRGGSALTGRAGLCRRQETDGNIMFLVSLLARQPGCAEPMRPGRGSGIRQSYLKPPLPDGRLPVRPRPQGWPARPAAPRLQEPPGAVFKPRPPSSCQPPARCSRGLAPSSSSGGWFPGHPEVLRIPTRSPGRSPAGDAHGLAPRLPGPHPRSRLSRLRCHCPSVSLLGHGPGGLGLEGAEGS
ncbi:hypothetical protein J1605_005750 [Eschrichtius robustus]|uniref:Uncharacterized protein n=1 Tax=Eschrichtius robustus TaxID=9764 RepID=A0AB34H8V2_ESCRO|nr:hypothetical protein J1605_005750 [Eschrichtius robustus]